MVGAESPVLAGKLPINQALMVVPTAKLLIYKGLFFGLPGWYISACYGTIYTGKEYLKGT